MNFVGYGSPQPLYQLQTALRERGARIGLVRVTNEHAAVAGLDAETVVFRVKGAGRAEPNPLDFEGRRWRGGEWFDRWWAALAPARREAGRRLVYTFLNEVFDVVHLPFWLGFYSELMAAANAHNVTVSVGNFAAATFGVQHVAALVPLAREAARRGHVMSGNVYEWSEDPERFKYLKPLMLAVPDAEWIVEELGWADDDARYRGYLSLKVLLNRYREVYPDVDAAFWCFNGSGGGWQHSHVDPEDLAAAILAR